MKKCLVTLIFFALMISLTVPSGVAAEGYKLGPGDVLSINVMGFEELTFNNPNEITVRPDGKIAYPFIGDVQVTGLSPEELARSITEQLSTYYVDPKVTVNVMKFHTIRVYVLGEVNKPGLYELDKDHTLLDAIGLAEGWTKDAAKKKVFIIQKNLKGEPLRVDLMALLKKGDISKNYSLSDGDVVFLNNNHRIDISRDILPLFNTAYYLHRWDKNSD